MLPRTTKRGKNVSVWHSAAVPDATLAGRSGDPIHALCVAYNRYLRTVAIFYVQGEPLTNFGEYVSFIWNVADLLRGPYRPNQYGRVILPMTVLRRLDCVLEPTKDKVLRKAAELKGQPESLVEKLLHEPESEAKHSPATMRIRIPLSTVKTS